MSLNLLYSNITDFSKLCKPWSSGQPTKEFISRLVAGFNHSVPPRREIARHRGSIPRNMQARNDRFVDTGKTVSLKLDAN